MGALALVAGCTSEPASSGADAGDGTGIFDSSVVHTVELAFDDAEYDVMIATFQETGEKEWITATVTIDGEVLEDVGLRLKGNSSLRGLQGTGAPAGAADDVAPEADATTAPDDVAATGDATEGAERDDAAEGGGRWGGGPGGEASADEPQTLPWLVRFDKFVDGQAYEGVTDVVIRSNTSQTSLNEAVALELTELAGLAAQDAAASRLTVNGSEEVLRLLVENPDETWEAANFDTAGALYKAESGGNYSYRGEDPEAYTDVFDQETGSDETDLTPLIGFLEFLDSSDDATFAAELADHLDVDAFARYLALQELIANTDDIDGPGNNSYLRYDSESGRFTVVTWDLNLAFGAMGTMGGGFGGMPDGERPTRDGQGGGFPGGGTMPEGMPTDLPTDFPTDLPTDFPTGALPDGMPMPGGMGGGPGGSNVLVERFMADETFAASYEAALADLTEELYGSGAAAEILERWTGVLADQAGDLVDEETRTEEAAAVEAYFDGTDEPAGTDDATSTG
jgi:spore coat protein CotH